MLKHFPYMDLWPHDCIHYIIFFKHFNCIFDILKTGFQFSVNLGPNLQCLLKEKNYLS